MKQNNLDSYTYVSKKKRRESCIIPDVEGSISSFNHSLEGTGSIPGTCMAEDLGDEIPVHDDIFKQIQKEFPTTEFPQKGAQFILPSGKFLNVNRSHGEVDEFIFEYYPEVDLTKYPNGYLVDCEQCIRVNDGRGKSFTSDRYITLPNYITSEQIYALEKWLKEYPYETITVSDTDHQVAEYNLVEEGIEYVINRIKRYKNTKALLEDTPAKSSEDLPDIAEENIIEQEDAGISSLFIDAINNSWSTIDDYHSIIVTLDSLGRHEFDDSLQELLESRNKEVGVLQGILELLSPAGSQIEQGKDEAQEQVAFDAVEESLTESREGFTENQVETELDFFKRNPKDYITYMINRKEFRPFYQKIKMRKDSGKHTNVKAITSVDKYINYCIIAAMLSYDELKNELLKHPSCYENELIENLMDYVDHNYRFSAKDSSLFESYVKKYKELTNNKKVVLKESWASNGSLQDFDPKTLVDKAFSNKCATNSVRDFEDKLLYINVDPGFVFGQRSGADKIWFDIVEIDKSTNEQNRIYNSFTQDKDAAINELNSWKQEYMTGSPSEESGAELEDDEVDLNNVTDIPNEGEEIDGTN